MALRSRRSMTSAASVARERSRDASVARSGGRMNTRSESARYQSGTKQIPNPFHKMAQDKVRDRERAVLEAEKEVTNQERYVAQYSQDVAREGDTPNTSTGAEQNLSNAQSRLDSARNRVNSERSQLQQARDDLGRTQPTTEEAVYSTCLLYTSPSPRD